MPKAKEAVLNYDPNIRNGVHKIKLTFGCWESRYERIVEIGGNIHGLANLDLESLVEDAAQDMYAEYEQENPDDENGSGFYFAMEAPNGNRTRCERNSDEDDWLEEDLKRMLIKAEIVEYKKEK